jgi:hypothetical protein
MAKMTKSSSNKQSTGTRHLLTSHSIPHGHWLCTQPQKSQRSSRRHKHITTNHITVVSQLPHILSSIFPLNPSPHPSTSLKNFYPNTDKATAQTISADPKGLLNKSTSFKQVCEKYGYHHAAHELLDNPIEELQIMGLEQPRFYVQTDNGNELAGSEAFQQAVDKHQYNLETTAPDSSGQNGIVKRPHQTLKERV